MRNTGLYISWITGKEDIIDIDEFEEIVLVVHQCILFFEQGQKIFTC